jgi:hypothetical protein
MKRKIFTAIAFILFLGIVQFITYYTIASDKLSEQAIKNIEVTPQLRTDTIIFSSVLSVCGNQQETIKPYNLHLSNKEHFKSIKKKLSPSILTEEKDFGMHCDKVVQEASKKMSAKDFEQFMSTHNPFYDKSKLYITALEDQKFFVTVNYNWSAGKEFFNEEDQYVWLFFSWLKI